MSPRAARPGASPDPRVRLAVALSALALVLVAPGPTPALAIGGVAAAALAAGRRLRWHAFSPALFVGLPAAALAAWLASGPALPPPAPGGATLPLAGLHRGAQLLARVLAAGLVSAWLSAGLRGAELAEALAAFRVPPQILELVLLADRHLHTLRESFDTIRAAQALRLGYVGLRRGVASSATLMGAVVCHALDQAGATAEAMQLRGDRCTHRPRSLRLGPADRRLLAGAATALLAGAVLGWGLPWR